MTTLVSCLPIAHPDVVRIQTDDGTHVAESRGDVWIAGEVCVVCEPTAAGTQIRIAAAVPVKRIQLRWQREISPQWQWLGDAWERAYGDLAWRTLVPERVMPWYVLVHDGESTAGFGVMTGCGAMASWQVDARGISLWLDVRSGGVGVELGDRELDAATIITRAPVDGESAFAAARALCVQMCPRPLMPTQPVYGGNNWYYAYGVAVQDDLIQDARRIAALSPDGPNRPYMVIDDCWQVGRAPTYTGGPWHSGHPAFPSMPDLAAEMTSMGVRPGIWYRPLLTSDMSPKSWLLRAPRPHAWVSYGDTLDPTVSGVQDRLREDMARLVGWGYDLVKHDFSTYELFGFWGSGLGGDVPADGWSFADRSKTNAEITLDLYRLLREAAGNALLLGCNTIGHLAAGIFEIQRTGDDVSGKAWERTRKMGVNTLAFRMPQHGTFFAHDADCVGLTTDVPWELNKQWLDLLAASGTPLFVSAQPDAMGSAQQDAVAAAFARAAKPQPPAEPLDWLGTTCPERWKLAEGERRFDWTGDFGTTWPGVPV